MNEQERLEQAWQEQEARRLQIQAAAKSSPLACGTPVVTRLDDKRVVIEWQRDDG